MAHKSVMCIDVGIHTSCNSYCLEVVGSQWPMALELPVLLGSNKIISFCTGGTFYLKSNESRNLHH